MGSPCRQPRPTFILGVGVPLIKIDDWKLSSSVFIQQMSFWLKLNILRAFSMYSKEMLSKAFEKSIWSIRPGRLSVLALEKRSKVFLVMSPMYLSCKYAFCQGCMSLLSMGLRRLVIVPEIIL